jgi:hypothetical protein
MTYFDRREEAFEAKFAHDETAFWPAGPFWRASLRRQKSHSKLEEGRLIASAAGRVHPTFENTIARMIELR